MNREVNTIGSKADGLRRVGADRDREGRAREDARAGAECRVGRGGRLVHRLGAVGHRQDDAGRAARRADARTSACRGRTRRGRSRAGETRRRRLQFRHARAVRGDARGGRVPRVGRRLRQPLRHRRAATPSGGWRRGDDLVLVIDVQGAREGARSAASRHVGIFVLPPSFEVLEQRLRGRSTDPEDADPAPPRRRRARRSPRSPEYDYVVVNDDARTRAVDAAARHRPGRALPAATRCRPRSRRS